jgi:hypothetical protein
LLQKAKQNRVNHIERRKTEKTIFVRKTKNDTELSAIDFKKRFKRVLKEKYMKNCN